MKIKSSCTVASSKKNVANTDFNSVLLSRIYIQKYNVMSPVLFFCDCCCCCFVFIIIIIIILFHFILNYSQSCLCDQSCKQQALVMTTFKKTHLNCDLNFVMKSFHQWPLPKVTATTFEITQLDFSFNLLLSSCKRPLRVLFIYIVKQFNETAHCTNGSLIKILGYFGLKKIGHKV